MQIHVTEVAQELVAGGKYQSIKIASTICDLSQ